MILQRRFLPPNFDSMEKKIVGIDCDEVLCLLMKDFIPYMSKKEGIDMKYEDMKEYDLNKYFHLEKKEVPVAKSTLCVELGTVS